MRKGRRDLFFSMTDHFLNNYVTHICGCSEHTRASYRADLNTFVDYVHDERRLDVRRFRFSDCTYDFLLDYRNWLIDERKLKASTVNHKVATLKSYMHYAALRDASLAQFDVAVSEVPMLTIPRGIRPVIDDEDCLRALLAKPKNTRLGRRDRLIMAMLFDTAIRVSELTGLKVRDVCHELEEPYILVHGKGRHERIVGLSDNTVSLIKGYVSEYHPEGDDEAPFFYTVIHGTRNAMSTRNVQRMLSRYGRLVKEDGYDIPDSVSPHMFRRTRGTMLLQGDVNVYDVATMLGHASPRTTLNHYAQTSISQKREAMRAGSENVPEEEQRWPEDMDEFKKSIGLK